MYRTHRTNTRIRHTNTCIRHIIRTRRINKRTPRIKNIRRTYKNIHPRSIITSKILISKHSYEVYFKPCLDSFVLYIRWMNFAKLIDWNEMLEAAIVGGYQLMLLKCKTLPQKFWYSNMASQYWFQLSQRSS